MSLALSVWMLLSQNHLYLCYFESAMLFTFVMATISPRTGKCTYTLTRPMTGIGLRALAASADVRVSSAASIHSVRVGSWMFFHTEAGTLRKLASESCSFVQECLWCSVAERSWWIWWRSDSTVKGFGAWWIWWMSDWKVKGFCAWCLVVFLAR